MPVGGVALTGRIGHVSSVGWLVGWLVVRLACLVSDACVGIRRKGSCFYSCQSLVFGVVLGFFSKG